MSFDPRFPFYKVILDVWGFNGESPDSGSWSVESTPSLMASGLCKSYAETNTDFADSPLSSALQQL